VDDRGGIAADDDIVRHIAVEYYFKSGIQVGRPLPAENFWRIYAKHTFFIEKTCLFGGLRGE